MEGFELEIVLSFVKWKDGDCVVELESVGVGCVVNKDHLGHLTVYYSEVFHIHALGSYIAVLSEESMVNVLGLGIEMVQNDVGIA